MAEQALRQEAWQAWSCCNQSIQNLFYFGDPPVIGNLSKRSFPDDYKDWRLQPVDFYSRLKVERNVQRGIPRGTRASRREATARRNTVSCMPRVQAARVSGITSSARV